MKSSKFNKELSKNLPFGIMLIGVMLIFFSGYYLNAVSSEIKNKCEQCFADQQCSDNNIICGDFGVYHLKTMILVFMGVMGASLTIFSTLNARNELKSFMEKKE